MKDQLQEILDSLDEKTPRSRLAPYRDFIAKLRRRKYTYREIRRILREKCQVQVSISTLHDFVRAQARKKTQRLISATAVSERPKPQTAQPKPDVKRFEYDPDISRFTLCRMMPPRVMPRLFVPLRLKKDAILRNSW